MRANLDARQINLNKTMLHISGAIQVLEELLNDKIENKQNFESIETHEMHKSGVV